MTIRPYIEIDPDDRARTMDAYDDLVDYAAGRIGQGWHH